MKLNREKLVERLEQVYPATSTNPIMPHYSYFKVISGQDSTNDQLQAYDGCTLVNTYLSENLGVGSLAIPAESFLKLLRSLNDEEIELSFKDGEITVKTNEIKGSFVVLNEISSKRATLSDTPIEDKTIIQDIVDGLNICRLFVSRDQTLGPMCGVMIDEDKLVATDRYRIVVWKLGVNISIRCSVPSEFFDIVMIHRDGIKQIHFVGNVGFTVVLDDDTQISTTPLGGEYPNVLQYFPTSPKFRKIGFSNEMSTAIERHISFLSQVDLIDKEISIRVLKNRCITKSESKMLGSLVDEFIIMTEEDLDIEFLVNPIFLKDIVNICSCFKYYDECGLILFESDKLSKSDKLQYLAQLRKK